MNTRRTGQTQDQQWGYLERLEERRKRLQCQVRPSSRKIENDWTMRLLWAGEKANRRAQVRQMDAQTLLTSTEGTCSPRPRKDKPQALVSIGRSRRTSKLGVHRLQFNR